MPYHGHVENGVIVLDEPLPLEDGTPVLVERIQPQGEAAPRTPLRGTSYRYDRPFDPATHDEDWEAGR